MTLREEFEKALKEKSDEKSYINYLENQVEGFRKLYYTPQKSSITFFSSKKGKYGN